MIAAPVKSKKIGTVSKKRNKMTIAIGMLCHDGIIIAADTQLVWTDGTTRTGTKVWQLATNSAQYVIANASNDGLAVDTLIQDIFDKLEREDPIDLRAIEKTIRKTMHEWTRAYSRQDIPSIALVIGVKLTGIQEGEKLALYHCGPPNTMIRITPEDGGYIAVGGGSLITDPIFRTLFSCDCSAHTAIHQMSYLMYRAKKDAASICGGETSAIFLSTKLASPISIPPINMEIAESQGESLDFVLRTAVLACFTDNPQSAEVLADVTKTAIISRARSLATSQFPIQ